MIGNLVTQSAINTVSYYMLEFNDAFNENWMMGFDSYRSKGFQGNLWTNYIEKMINMDKQLLEVNVNCITAMKRSGQHVVVDQRRSGGPRGENGEVLDGLPSVVKVTREVGKSFFTGSSAFFLN
jgi:hypothetical protein